MAPPMTFKGFMDLQGGGAKKPSAAKPPLQAPPIIPLPTQGAKLPGGFGAAMPPATTATDVLNILTQLARTPISAPPPPVRPPPPGYAEFRARQLPAAPPPAMAPLTGIPLPTQNVDYSSVYGQPGVPTPTAWGSDVEQVWSLTGYTPPPLPRDVPYPTPPPPIGSEFWRPRFIMPGTPRPRTLAAANPLLSPPAPRGTATGWLTLGAPPPRVPRWRLLPDRDVARRVSPKWDPVDVIPWRASPTGTPPLLRRDPRRE